MKSIRQIAFVVRAARIFLHTKMTTKRLISMTEEDLLKIKGLGKVTLKEIKISLAEEGLQLKKVK